MGGLDRLRRRIHVTAQRGASGTSRDGLGVDDEGLLRERLSQDPNDIEAFARLAEVVRRHAIEGHGADSVAELDRTRAADDAVWALSLGLGHWRPAEHDVEAGRELVEAAVEADRPADARRHLDALLAHPDQARVAELRPELERLVAGGGRPRVVDVRSERGSRLRSFLRL